MVFPKWTSHDLINLSVIGTLRIGWYVLCRKFLHERVFLWKEWSTKTRPG